MDRRKLMMRIAAGAASVLLLGVVMTLFSTVGEMGFIQRGAQEGFELRGTYAKASDGTLLTFGYHDEDFGAETWMVQGDEESTVTGYVKATDDPNCYILEDENGVEVGWVHLAYLNREGEGSLFVRYQSDELVEMTKASKVPVLIVY